MPAEVDESKCDGCRACVEVCPSEAITVEDVARVNPDECVDIGARLKNKQNRAITLPG